MRQDISILVVDDQQESRESLTRILTNEGYTVESVATGDAALAGLRRRPFSLVLTDVTIPGVDGFDLIQSIKKEFPSVAVIVLTAYGDSYTVKDALLLGADEYITKPFKSFEINLVVERAYWRLASTVRDINLA